MTVTYTHLRSLTQRGVVDDVRLTAFLEEEWQDSVARVPEAVRRYVGTERGVTRIYPGIQLPTLFAPRDRDWFVAEHPQNTKTD